MNNNKQNSKRILRGITSLIVTLIVLVGIYVLSLPLFSVNSEEQSLKIYLPNESYLELKSSSDYILETNGNIYYPFKRLDNASYWSRGIDFIFLKRDYFQEVINNDNSRLIYLERLEKDKFDLKYKISTNLYYGDTSIYTIQIDYSNNSDITITDNEAVIRDGKCTINILNQGKSKMQKLNNISSIIFFQKYSDELQYELKFKFNCD